MRCVVAKLFRLGAIQLRVGADLVGNVDEACDRIRTAAALGANVVCLPELFR
mgnify:FL=1